ncbi:SIS domain-containing protein [Salidesulfovibrio brasiliensis]
MCGIASFLSNNRWREEIDNSWLNDIAEAMRTAAKGELAEAEAPLEALAGRFSDLMSFSLHMELVSNPDALARVESLRDDLRTLRNRASLHLKEGVRTDELEALLEKLEDYLWQVNEEVLANLDRVRAIMPADIAGDASRLACHYLAWGTEQVLESIDKLEVRGRDSAGVAVSLLLPAGVDPEKGLSAEERTELSDRVNICDADTRQVIIRKLDDGRTVCRFLYKVAQLVGQLGDNGSALRDFIRTDSLLWKMGGGLTGLNIIAHTRWASNGIISVPNCHPVDGLVEGDVSTGLEKTMFVLNGDVDNYRSLVEQSVLAKGATIPLHISTDAKILPVLFHLDAPEGADPEARFRNVLHRSEGSLAVVMQDMGYPDCQFLAQKGSGQSFYVGSTLDGWIVASEAYGLAARCRSSYPMTASGAAGASVMLCSDDPEGAVPVAMPLDGSESIQLVPEVIQIFSRDIFRGDYEFYIEKEVHEASDSVRNTLVGKYIHKDDRVEFLPEGFGNGPALIERLRDTSRPIRKIIGVGQGTAAVAAMGVSQLLHRALAGTGIVVESYVGSELIGFMAGENMDDVLLVPVSQSGTTTDTNRVVDLCRESGAWVNAIVNRRNSPLVLKADSHIYTSNGRDVEMAVASTKAFYSQIAAGKLLALWLASELGSMSPEDIAAEVRALESLPDKIDAVLANKDAITDCAEQYAPAHRYWAVVGNGPNRIAAEEVRIKLSELCYKSIPCDVTEDKKHIDLSTEPLTVVMANDLPEMVVSDTVKEATIFKAHNGKPLVVCAEDEDRFDGACERTLKTPRVGGGLDFVLATVVGHWWGIAAAKAIDAQAAPFREARMTLAGMIESPDTWDREALLTSLNGALDRTASGMTDSALPARVAAALANYMLWLATQPTGITAMEARLDTILNTLNKAIEEMTRPIDTIRHQAKTVTVGISRPKE